VLFSLPLRFSLPEELVAVGGARRGGVNRFASAASSNEEVSCGKNPLKVTTKERERDIEREREGTKGHSGKMDQCSSSRKSSSGSIQIKIMKESEGKRE
jgi:hypothetical protein